MIFSVGISRPNSAYREDELLIDLEESLVNIRYGFLIEYSLVIILSDLGSGPDEFIRTPYASNSNAS